MENVAKIIEIKFFLELSNRGCKLFCGSGGTLGNVNERFGNFRYTFVINLYIFVHRSCRFVQDVYFILPTVFFRELRRR